MMRFFILSSFLWAISLQLQAQNQSNNEGNALESGSIAEQFEYINSVSSNYQEYKVIKRVSLDKLQSNILDSIGQYQTRIRSLNDELGQSETRIGGLNEELSNTNSDYERAVAEKDSFSFLGILIHKSLYNNLVWGIIILLALILVISYFRFMRSHKVTAETQKNLDELREEYEQHRRNTLERERKLNRQLVDALNKKEN